MLSRTEPDLSSAWVYDTATKGVGKLTSASASSGYLRTHAYDSLGRPTDTAIEIGSTTYTTSTTYDSTHGRVDTITYPSGFQVQHTYTSLGYLASVRNAATTSTVYWTANTMNAERQLTQFTHGNDVQTNRAYQATTGRPTSIQAGTSNSVQNLSYSWDPMGNLLSRTDSVPSTAVTEEFEYDALNRLTGSAIGTDEKAFAYDSIGNLTSKSDVGSYSYPSSGSSSVRPHAVSSITGTVNGITNPSFTYDANGNMTAGLGRTVTWTSYNMVATVVRGTQELAFTYDSEHQRIKQGVTAANERTIYINAQVRSERLEVASSSALIRWNNYIYAGGEMVAVFYDNASTTDQTRFFHKDHLGSISVITDESGAVVQRLAYDAWGKRRNATTWADDPSEAISPTVLTDRGYTGHEHLDEVALIHMNGRIYDPQLARFMSADPFIQDVMNTQSLNRYSYVINNPLAYTDPNGYFFKSIFRAISNIFSNPAAIVAIAAAVIVPQIAGPYLASLSAPGAFAAATTSTAGIASVGFATVTVTEIGVTVGLSSLGSATAAAIGGFAAGAIAGGDLKSALVGAGSSAAFFGVGELTGHGKLAFGSGAHAANMAGHAAVGCSAAALSGGRCGAGALSAGMGSLAGPVIPSNDFTVRLVAHSVIGGTTSVAAGGSFANGAVTGAFGYLFNEMGNEFDRGYRRRTMFSRLQDIPILGKFFEGYNIGGAAGGQFMFGLGGYSYDIGALFDTSGRNCDVITRCVLVGAGIGAQVYEGGQVGNGKLNTGDTGIVGITGGLSLGDLGFKVSPQVGSDGSVSGNGGFAQGPFIGGALRICGQQISSCR